MADPTGAWLRDFADRLLAQALELDPFLAAAGSAVNWHIGRAGAGGGRAKHRRPR